MPLTRLQRVLPAQALLVCLLVSSALPPARAQDQAPPGTTLHYFGHIDDGVFVGSKPHTDRDYQFLQSEGVKYILNVRFLPFLSWLEKRKAKQYGMKFIAVEMNASPIPPCEKHVNKILLTMRDRHLQPIYVHCVLGRDRTNLISGLYKIYFLGVPKDVAWREMRQSGFKTWWILRGLKTYFDHHAGKRPAALDASARRP